MTCVVLFSLLTSITDSAWIVTNRSDIFLQHSRQQRVGINSISSNFQNRSRREIFGSIAVSQSRSSAFRRVHSKTRGYSKRSPPINSSNWTTCCSISSNSAINHPSTNRTLTTAVSKSNASKIYGEYSHFTSRVSHHRSGVCAHRGLQALFFAFAILVTVYVAIKVIVHAIDREH